MKFKLLVLFSAVMSATSVFGAYQYGDLVESTVSVTPYQNRYFEGFSGNYYTPQVSDSVFVYLVDDIRSISAADAVQRRLTNQLSDFGYVSQDGKKVSWTGEKVLANEFQVNKWNPKVSQYAYKVGAFSPADEITLWMTNKYGETVYSNTPQWFNYQGGYGIAGTDFFGNTLAVADFWGDNAYFSIAQQQSPSGQPLPGVLLSLAIGGACVSLMKRKAKKSTL